MPNGPWTDAENDLIVADYFAMLTEDVTGQPYNKATHNRDLQTRIDRNRSSIEFKYQNISAVLRALGEDWIPGYKPAQNYQTTLEDAVARWLELNPDWLERLPGTRPAGGLREATQIWIGPPPTMSNQLPPAELERTIATARRFDVAERDERNRALGRAGEKRALAHEKAVLIGSGRSDLASKVCWVSQEYGDGAGYDIASYEPDGRPRLVEVKTTNGWERTPFHISRNELAVADDLFINFDDDRAAAGVRLLGQLAESRTISLSWTSRRQRWRLPSTVCITRSRSRPNSFLISLEFLATLKPAKELQLAWWETRAHLLWYGIVAFIQAT